MSGAPLGRVHSSYILLLTLDIRPGEWLMPTCAITINHVPTARCIKLWLNLLLFIINTHFNFSATKITDFAHTVLRFFVNCLDSKTLNLEVINHRLFTFLPRNLEMEVSFARFQLIHSSSSVNEKWWQTFLGVCDFIFLTFISVWLVWHLTVLNTIMLDQSWTVKMYCISKVEGMHSINTDVTQ